MTEISVRLAVNDSDIKDVRALCEEWLDWHWKAYPEDWPIKGNPLEPERFQVILKDLPKLHARPNGAMLIALVDGKPAGSVMYAEAEAGTAEFNRMFVSEGGRGHGLGRLMLERMFEQMISDGYKKVMFSSARFLTHAKAMYESAGFVDMPHPQGFPNEWRSYVYFMERAL
ncbi:MAG: GNAT family N-acetyltransferase [Paracoccaceae bacterium]